MKPFYLNGFKTCIESFILMVIINRLASKQFQLNCTLLGKSMLLFAMLTIVSLKNLIIIKISSINSEEGYKPNNLYTPSLSTHGTFSDIFYSVGMQSSGCLVLN